MSTFYAQSEIGADGKPKLSMGSEHNRARFATDLKKNPGARYKIERLTPESRQQRGFYEGAVIPLIAYYQEGFDHNEWHDCKEVRNWLSREFNGEFRVMAGTSVKMAKSTKGELNRGLLERVLDWMGENGYKIELLNPERYKKWKNEVYPYGGPESYIDYLVECGELRKLSPA